MRIVMVLLLLLAGCATERETNYNNRNEVVKQMCKSRPVGRCNKW